MTRFASSLTNVATLPGIQRAAYAMPDAHWGYGFPIGGVAAFDPKEGGVISAGGVGFDISCGVRALRTTLRRIRWTRSKRIWQRSCSRTFQTGVVSTGLISLSEEEMDQMLRGGARWAVARGYGQAEDLDHIEENGCASDARPEFVSHEAKKRQAREMGTLWDPATIIWRSSEWRKSTTRRRPLRSGCGRMRWW